MEAKLKSYMYILYCWENVQRCVAFLILSPLHRTRLIVPSVACSAHIHVHIHAPVSGGGLCVGIGNTAGARVVTIGTVGGGVRDHECLVAKTHERRAEASVDDGGCFFLRRRRARLEHMHAIMQMAHVLHTTMNQSNKQH